jgi:hypothetical protein
MSTENSSDPLIRVMALHALAYCERLFYASFFLSDLLCLPPLDTHSLASTIGPG